MFIVLLIGGKQTPSPELPLKYAKLHFGIQNAYKSKNKGEIANNIIKWCEKYIYK